MGATEHIGALRHEVHAAEDDVLRRPLLRRAACQLERVAGVVGELDHLVSLIVMTEDEQALAQVRLGRRDPLVHLGIGQAEIPIRERLALGDLTPLDVG
jgi:hypothetical protein